MKHAVMFLLCAAAGCATEAPTAAPTVVTTDVAAKTACWDGVTLPRPALEPAALPSVADKYAAYTAALADYQVAAAAFSDLASAHAAAYDAVAAAITGQRCATSADCATGDPAFPGVCVQPYYGVGARCYVSDATPVGAGPQPPPPPVITCADLSCAALPSYACETEPNTGTNACILSRCGGGGGGGGKTGGGKP